MNAKSDRLAGGTALREVAYPCVSGPPASTSPGPLSGLPGFGVPTTASMFKARTEKTYTSTTQAGRQGATKKPHLYLRRERPSNKHPAGKPCWVCKNDTGIASATTPTYAFRAWRRNLEYKTRIGVIK